MRTTFLSIGAAAALAATSGAQNPLYSFEGQGLLEHLGAAVASVGDLNADGYADFAVGAPQDARLGKPGVVRVYSGRDARLLWTFSGDRGGDGFGVAVAGVGDADRDGTPDVAVGATPAVPSAKTGYVRLFSGKTGKPLWTIKGGSPGDWFGVSVRGCGDVDRDGHADIVVGAPFADVAGTDTGSVRVVSGKTAKTIHVWTGAARDDFFGFSVDGAGDFDKDGWPDIVVGAYRNDSAARDAGRATVYSGRNAKVIQRWTGTGIDDGFGFAVAGANDIDRDGWADVLVGALWEDPRATDTGAVWVYSGKTRLPLQHIPGNAAFDGLGTSVAALGDVDGDGWSDLAAGAIQAFPPGRPGYVRVWSGKDFRMLYQFDGTASGDWFGSAVAAAGDTNGDGFGDLLVGAPRESKRAARGGSAHVYAGNHVALSANLTALSLARGGVQILSLDARKVHARKTYWVLGTAGATRPGLQLGVVHLPLSLDGYFDLTLSAPNSLLLRLTLGQLDAAGRRVAFFNLPPGLPPALAGTTLHHAFVVIDSGGFSFASNPVPVRLLK